MARVLLVGTTGPETAGLENVGQKGSKMTGNASTGQWAHGWRLFERLELALEVREKIFAKLAPFKSFESVNAQPKKSLSASLSAIEYWAGRSRSGWHWVWNCRLFFSQMSWLTVNVTYHWELGLSRRPLRQELAVADENQFLAVWVALARAENASKIYTTVN